MLADTQVKSEFSLPPVKEASRLPVSGTLTFGTELINPAEHFEITAGIIKTIDIDGSNLYLPAFQEQSFGGSTLPLPDASAFSLSQDQQDRLKFASEQNINPLLATHLALNTDLPIGDFINYASEVTPDIISFYGFSGALKSKSLALMHYIMKVPVFSFDSFSSRGLETYLQEINKLPPGADISQLLESISNVKVSDVPQKLTFRETLNKFLEFTRKNPDFLYLIDLPGVDLSQRELDIYDTAAFFSTNAFELNRRSSDDSEMNVIMDYFDQARIMGPGASISSWSRNVAFKNQINSLGK